MSNIRKITCGVPQGSILDPFIFLLYIIDLFNVNNNLHFTLFAGDTAVFYSHL